MVRNKMSNLADTLFAQLESLDDRELSENELQIEIERSKAMISVAGQIVSIGKLAIEVEKLKQEAGIEHAPIALLEG
ncbi:TPA: hypothetical protein U1C42_000253 [Streptococcus suis]|nr:hypothetical protein [Streptococcus suis]HEM3658342.1 hypothetical protein [Streptococcus suis]